MNIKLPVPEPKVFIEIVHRAIYTKYLEDGVVDFKEVAEAVVSHYDLPPVDIEVVEDQVNFNWVNDIPIEWKRLGHRLQ